MAFLGRNYTIFLCYVACVSILYIDVSNVLYIGRPFNVKNPPWKKRDILLWLHEFSFVVTPRKFIIAKLSIRKLGSSSVLIIAIIHSIINTDEDPSLRIESFAILNFM